VVKLRKPAPGEPPPYWAESIRTGVSGPAGLHPAVDAVLQRRGLDFKVTREYPRAGGSWSPEERADGLDRFYRLVLLRGSSIPPDMVEEIRLIPDVEEVGPGRIGVADMPAKPAVRQMAAGGYREPQRAIGLELAHRFTRGDRRVTVAMLDTGVDLDHPELGAALVPGFDFVDVIRGTERFVGDFVGADPDPDDEVGHGTHVAGIIAAAGRGMAPGVVPQCRLMPVRVLAAMQKPGGGVVGAGLVDNINVAIKWAADRGADVINMSLGVRWSGGELPHEAAVNYARRKGVTLVAASGNSGAEEVYYPSGHPWVITVGALDGAAERPAEFSTYGRHVDFMAPGTAIYSSYLEGRYAYSSGTSHAAPFLAGAVAMLKSLALKLGRRLSDKGAKHVLKHSADKLGRRFKDPRTGFGALNLADALRLLKYRLQLQRSGS
jgi:subtilisin family serine protease